MVHPKEWDDASLRDGGIKRSENFVRSLLLVFHTILRDATSKEM